MSKTIILTSADIENRIRRIAYQIYETNFKEEAIVLAGIEKKGFIFAQKIKNILNDISNLKIELCSISIDKKNPLKPIITSLNSNDYKGKSVIIVDDVLHSGTTLMYTVRHFLSTPLKQLKTAVLVDRNHKKYPIKVDFKGISLSTSLQDMVRVVFSKKGDQAYLE